MGDGIRMGEGLTAIERSPGSVCFRSKFSSAKVLVP